MYVNQKFTKEITGLNGREIDLLLGFLWEHSIRAEFSVRFQWESGSIAFLDNRSTQHLAIRDVYDTDFDREFYRATLNGEVPVGVDAKKSTGISRESIKPVRS